MERQKITERYTFSEDEKWEILKKTDQRCAHCGKPIFAIKHIDNMMTVDHFIPLHKGGTNRLINLIGLCQDCNADKADKIVNPDGYLRYLKSEYLDEIRGYYESYIHSFKYITETNMLADDEFTINVPYYPLTGMRYNAAKPAVTFKYQVKKVFYDDLDRVLKYYISYLKKYDVLESEETAKEDISGWFENGCMYYVEKNGSIVLLAAFNICHVNTENYSGSAIELWSFSLYNRQQAGELLSKLVFHIPKKIMKENNVPAIPVVITTVKTDRIYAHLTLFSDVLKYSKEFECTYRYFRVLKYSEDGGLVSCSPKTLLSTEKAQMQEFMNNFKDPYKERNQKTA